MTEIHHRLNQPYNSLRSQNFGRYLFKFKWDAQNFWLKQQKLEVSDLHEQWYLNEINIYQYLKHESPELLLPFQLLHREEGNNSKFISPMLCLAHSNVLFDRIDCYQDITQIKDVLIRSLNLIASLHHLNIVHADLKFDHFRMLDGRATLIDFEQSFDSRLAHKFENHGTPRYMAPELFNGELRSFATDIYALGIIWLEWLNQEKIQKNNYMDWAIWHCQQQKVELKTEFTAFEAIIRGMLMKKKSSRLVNICQIKQLLNEID